MVVFSDWTCPGMLVAIWTPLELHFKERFYQKARALYSKNIWPKRNSCIFFIPIWPLKMSNCWFFLPLLFIPSSHHQSFVFTCNYSIGLVGNPHIYLPAGAARGSPSRAPLRSHQEGNCSWVVRSSPWFSPSRREPSSHRVHHWENKHGRRMIPPLRPRLLY